MSDALKLYINQTLEHMAENTGIGRVVYAQYKHLPTCGVELVTDQHTADLTLAHAADAGVSELDIFQCHGMYWTGDPGSGEYNTYHHDINAKLMSAARRARHVFVPSQWVAMPFRRDMRLGHDDLTVIGHGLDVDAWEPAFKHGGYALHGKSRESDVCTSRWAALLAARGVDVVSTFAPRDLRTIPETMTVIGEQKDPAQMKAYIQQAGVYLATTKETFGIQTLEAMACGVPVLGFSHGGTKDIIEHQKTGYLVQPGDSDGLLTGYHWLMERRDEIAANCLEAVKAYDWPLVMARYAEALHGVLERKRQERRGVSVVIPCYNYAQYVTEAIDSCLMQDEPPDEIIIVDDGSTDDSLATINTFTAPFLGLPESPAIHIIRQENQGVAAARNAGIDFARNEYILCLDADDMLDRRATSAMHQAMLKHRGLGVAYTGLGVLRDGKMMYNQGWPPVFDWHKQGGLPLADGVAPPAGNVIPIASMFRKTMWRRIGGFQQVHAPGEDGAFWTEGLSIGFEAERVTEEPLFHYRLHKDSASRTKHYKRIDQWMPWMRDHDYPMAAPARVVPNIRSYEHPLVTVVVAIQEVVDFHTLNATFHSILGQTLREWECLVLNTSDFRAYHEDVDLFVSQRYPFAALSGAIYPSFIHAPLLLTLRAGEYIAPTALEEGVLAWIETGDLGGFKMGCKHCGPQGEGTLAIKARGLQPSERTNQEPEGVNVSGLVRMKYIGSTPNAMPAKSPYTRQTYKASTANPYINVMPQDVDWLLSFGRPAQYERVYRADEQRGPVVAPPEVIEPLSPGAVLRELKPGRKPKGGGMVPDNLLNENVPE